MPQPAVTSVLGPWRRVIDTARAGKPDPDSLRDLVDGVILPTGAVASRPGSQTLAAMLGAGDTQGFACMELAGTIYTIGVRGGVLQTYDWTADAWTAVTHTGTTINVTGPVFLGSFFDELVVSDGVNKPWHTTIGSGTGAYIPVSGPVTGPMVAKDAKLFGILAADHRTAVWSEEADLTIGWDTAGYNNAWDLRQTSQAALVTLRASNSALVYQRERSTGQILGAVNDEFQASGTHDDVAARGTTSPFASVLDEDGRLWAIDADGRPYRVASGQDVDDIWLACEATVATVDRGRLALAWGIALPDLDCVGFALPRTTGNVRNTDLLWFDRTTGDYAGRWRVGLDLAWGARCTDDNGVERLVILDHAGTPSVVWTVAEAEADTAKSLDVVGVTSAGVPTRMVTSEAQAEGADQIAWIQWTALVIETGEPQAGSMPPVLSRTSTGTTLAYECETPGHGFGTNRHDGTVITVGPNGRKEIGIQRWGRWIRTAWSPVLGAGSERFRVWRTTVLGSVRDTLTARR